MKKKQINPLITSLYLGDLGVDEFLEKYFQGINDREIFVNNLIKDGITNEDPISVEEFIVLIYTHIFEYNRFTLILCQLLDLTWHNRHEDIAMLLGEIKDPLTVDCLYKASELQFDYLDYDDTYQFARKCIKGLVAIGDENALNKLKLLSKSNVEIISSYAKKELKYKDI